MLSFFFLLKWGGWGKVLRVENQSILNQYQNSSQTTFGLELSSMRFSNQIVEDEQRNTFKTQTQKNTKITRTWSIWERQNEPTNNTTKAIIISGQ